jgi:hypothetical protein
MISTKCYEYTPTPRKSHNVVHAKYLLLGFPVPPQCMERSLCTDAMKTVVHHRNFNGKQYQNTSFVTASSITTAWVKLTGRNKDPWYEEDSHASLESRRNFCRWFVR